MIEYVGHTHIPVYLHVRLSAMIVVVSYIIHGKDIWAYTYLQNTRENATRLCHDVLTTLHWLCDTAPNCPYPEAHMISRMLDPAPHRYWLPYSHAVMPSDSDDVSLFLPLHSRPSASELLSRGFLSFWENAQCMLILVNSIGKASIA